MQSKIENINLINTIKARFEEFRKQSPDPKQDVRKVSALAKLGSYNFTRSEFCKPIYLETKNFFAVYQDQLSPEEKLSVLKEYLRL